MAKYAIYITVNPKDFLDIAAPINSTVAIRKKMYAQNIGGFGENHIKIPDATKLEAIPTTSQKNLKGLVR